RGCNVPQPRSSTTRTITRAPSGSCLFAQESAVDHVGGLLDAIERDEPAEPRPLLRPHQHLIETAEPGTQWLEPMCVADRVDFRLKRLRIRRPLPATEQVAKIRERRALPGIRRTEPAGRLHEVIVIRDRVPCRR